ncbi:universal stress protein [Haloplanus aerogenes]|uniref:Nucleotide-binding universal stress UspA family protein n=1 Tax=Haloplanus aerogenes TaxID=660522 RepID=A0A3M0CZU6_9EURY|nr:universal stress protein [Haloplanus aerogenes]AZH26723.1 universal stress protein [Haloplanus aerogenes]RMB12966.1 nucleotide-binding universal stress UspA family protein [Haloplanus aerogenes]
MYDSILIPFDGSDEAEKGANHGLGLAETCGATVHALYVIDLPGAPRTVYLRDDEDEMRERYREYGEEVTNEIKERAEDRGLECVTAIRSGSPGEEIVDYAKDEGVDAIVLGSAYRGKLGALLGSTAEKVVRTAEVPVVTVREQMND